MGLRFDVNLSYLFTEKPFFDRFQMARDAGFTHVEFGDVLELDQKTVIKAIEDSGATVVQYNVANGNTAAGERGFTCRPDRRPEWRSALLHALEIAEQIHPIQINSLVGNHTPGLSQHDLILVLGENLRWISPHLERAGIPLMLELLNRQDHPHYLLHNTSDMLSVLQAVHSPWIRFQFDFYHIQRSDGDLINRFYSCLPHIGHVQIADNPGRHEPGTGEINFHSVLGAIQRSEYNRFVGLEFTPARDTESSLAWLPTPARSGFCDVAELSLCNYSPYRPASSP